MVKTNQNKTEKKLDITDIIGYLAIIIIVISLIFIGLRITGYSTTDTATVNVTIVDSVAINFTVDFINFGSGYVSTGYAGAYLNTENNVTGGSWTNISTPLVLENIGNVNATIKLLSSKNATTFIGGNGPQFKVKVSDKSGNTGACTGGAAGSYIEINTTNITICSPLQYDDAKDEIDIDIQLYIPNDASVGGKTTTLTAGATQS